MRTYTYENHAILIDKLCIYQYPLDDQRFLQDTPVASHLDVTGLQKIDTIIADDATQFERYKNENGEIIYEAGKILPDMFPVGSIQSDRQTCVAFCDVKSYADADVSIRLVCNCKSKVFLNGILLAMNDQTVDQFVKGKLVRGTNHFVFECYHIASETEISIRICDLAREEAERLDALECFNCSTYNRFLSVVYSCELDNGVIKYYAYLDDQVNKYSHMKFVGLVLDQDYGIIGSFCPRLNQCETLNLSDFDLHNLEIPVIVIRFKVFEGDVLYYETQRPFIIGDLGETNTAILSGAEQMLDRGALSPYDRYYLNQRMQFAYRIGTTALAMWSQTSFIRPILKHMANGLCMRDILQMPRNHFIHFKNPIDNHDDMYSVVVPNDYDDTKQYPLIININNANHDNQFIFYNYNLEKGVIFADIFLKGLTLGSYIGETAFFAYLSDMKKRFHIDEDKIYITGGCNGAYAVYALAQNHPHVFAAVMAISGTAYFPAINNLYSLPVYNVYSETEKHFDAQMTEQNPVLSKLPLMQHIHIEACSHRMLMRSMQRKNIVDALLLHSRDKYPRHIKYHTERNYHRSSYWIELLGISFGERFAEVEAIADRNSITITLRNCVGVHIQIPPYVERGSFQVVVNDHIFAFSHYRRKYVTIALCDGEYKEISDKPHISNIKGLGILSAFTKPLSIVCDKTNQAQMRAAEKLAEPSTMAYKPSILVKYPIVNYERTKSAKRNLIVIRRYDYKTLYDGETQVLYGESGYTYKGVFHEGKYIIMEAVNLPADKSVALLITYNDERFLSKMLFLRKMMIPTYYSGYHELLNNQILIYDGVKYYAVYETYAALTEVHF